MCPFVVLPCGLRTAFALCQALPHSQPGRTVRPPISSIATVRASTVVANASAIASIIALPRLQKYHQVAAYSLDVVPKAAYSSSPIPHHPHHVVLFVLKISSCSRLESPHDPSPCSKIPSRRSSLKASARPPITSSSPNGGTSAHMPSLSSSWVLMPPHPMERCPTHPSRRHPDGQRRPRASGRLTTWTPHPPIRKKPRLPCQLPHANTRTHICPPSRPRRTATNARISQIHRQCLYPQTCTTQTHSPPAPPHVSCALPPLRVQRPAGAAQAQEQDHQNPRRSANDAAQSCSARYRSARS
ncbi:hypothetical protein V8E53_013576 [Lactarius tabidus]